MMKNYYFDLSKVQNRFCNIDIMTITGFMNKQQKIDHLLRYAKQAKLFDIVKKYSI